MNRARKAPDVPLAKLRLSDLTRAAATRARRRVVNLKVPADVLSRVHQLAHRLGVTKTAAFIALLNEGVQEAHRRGINRPPPGRR